jgi:hypothetical protein
VNFINQPSILLKEFERNGNREEFKEFERNGNRFD